MLDVFYKLTEEKSLMYRPQRGILRIYGREAKDFLQRMSTADMHKLSPTNPVGTCFINNKGRMVEFAVVFEVAPLDLVLVTSEPDNKTLFDWLSGFHFVEDLSFDTDYTAEVSIIISPSKSALSPGCVIGEALIGSQRICFALALNQTEQNNIIDEDAWQTLRIMALLPDYPHEINNVYMPQAINLGQFIADDKGCYIGQEVIAKATTYQKHSKTLCGALISLTDWHSLAVGAKILGPKGQDGLVTSRAPLYEEHQANALVMVDLEQTNGREKEDNVVVAQALIAKTTK